MSDRIEIVAEQRVVSEENAKRLRKTGWIPAVIYGQGSNYHVKLENLSLRRVLRDAGGTSLININVEGDEHTVLAREIQSHPTKGDIIHVDFYEVNMSETLIVDATLVAIGSSRPVVEGLGTTSLVLYTLQIECLPDNLISEIEVDLNLIDNPEDTVTVSDLSVPEGVRILAEPDVVIASFDYIQEEEEEEEELEEDLLFAVAPDDVEVISKGRQEEEEEEIEE